MERVVAGPGLPGDRQSAVPPTRYNSYVSVVCHQPISARLGAVTRYGGGVAILVRHNLTVVRGHFVEHGTPVARAPDGLGRGLWEAHGDGADGMNDAARERAPSC